MIPPTTMSTNNARTHKANGETNDQGVVISTVPSFGLHKDGKSRVQEEFPLKGRQKYLKLIPSNHGIPRHGSRKIVIDDELIEEGKKDSEVAFLHRQQPIPNVGEGCVGEESSTPTR